MEGAWHREGTPEGPQRLDWLQNTSRMPLVCPFLLNTMVYTHVLRFLRYRFHAGKQLLVCAPAPVPRHIQHMISYHVVLLLSRSRPAFPVHLPQQPPQHTAWQPWWLRRQSPGVPHPPASPVPRGTDMCAVFEKRLTRHHTLSSAHQRRTVGISSAL